MSRTRKKILYVITKSNFGGAQRYVYELASGLPPDSYEVAVACGGNGLLVTKLSDAHIPVFPMRHLQRDMHLGNELRAAYELFRIIQTYKPDIVHLNSSKAGGIGALIARLCGVPRIVFTAHGWPFYEPRGFVWRTLAWFFSYLTTLLAHAVIVVSAHDRDGARMWGLHAKIHLVHTALSPITFETREDARAALLSPELIQRHQGDTWLVALSEFNRNKNLGVLIEAVAELKRRGITNVFLTLISDGELRPHLEAVVQLHELSDQVHFTGFVPEARTFLKAFDIFVMPSLKEGFPYVLLEAGAAKLPVIASNVGGIPELIRDGVTGLLIDPHHPHTLVDALTELITRTYPRDLPPSITLGEALENEVRRAYTLPLMLSRTRFVYENGSRTL